jgi:virginiamycin A acetyltransferase
MPLPAPDSTVLHPIAGQRGVVFPRSLVQSTNVEVGYYDSDGDFLAFERDAVLYALGPERLYVGRFCAIASGVRFPVPGASYADVGPLTFPFGVFGPPWETTLDLVMLAPSRGDTVVGHDAWLGCSALVLPGVRIGHGAVVVAGRVVARDVSPYAVVAGNPARVVPWRFSEDDVERLLRAAWWNWPIELGTDHARPIMTGMAAELDRIATEHGWRER